MKLIGPDHSERKDPRSVLTWNLTCASPARMFLDRSFAWTEIPARSWVAGVGHLSAEPFCLVNGRCFLKAHFKPMAP